MCKKKKKQKKKQRKSNEYQIVTRSKIAQNKDSNNILQNKMTEPSFENLIQHLPCFDGKKEKNIDFFFKTVGQVSFKFKIK